MSGIFHDGRWHEDTGMMCRRCGRPVYGSDNPAYRYQCFYCDEDLYSFEAVEQDAGWLPKVSIACPMDGAAINTELEYMLDGNGKIRIFSSRTETEAFLSADGFRSEDMKLFYFVEVLDYEV